MAVPEGIAWKLARAAEQSRTIDAAIWDFIHRDPKTYEIAIQDDPQTRERTYRFELLVEPPAVEWAGMTGEVLHNLRSALDHLAYALCLENSPDRPPPSGTEFPIFHDEIEFERTSRGGGRYKIRGMSHEMQEAVRTEQPFSVGAHYPKAQSIWLLQEMSNIDKHRNLNFAAALTGQWAMFSNFEDPDVEVVPVWSEEGVIARARPRTPEAVITSDPIFVPQVVFDEAAGPGKDRPVDIALITFVRIVGEIVERLSSFLMPKGKNS